ncbi:MAG: DUF2085 domain-containing protein [Thermomicrobiales bacterium]|nr:DUF2085 domain-containing protein [Thermomicrobiales bacterium]
MTFMPAPPGIDSQAASTPSTEPFYRRHLVALVVFFAGMGFLAAPWPFETKAHAVMHGLCAQTPSHSFYFQGLVLPFDGRMTGIYGGVLSAFLILLALGRHRAAGLPSSGSLVILLLFVVAMAVDGFNSLLTDLQRWHPYQPSNELRLLTGWMAGVAIGTVVVMLVGMTFWRSPRVSQRVVSHWWLPILMVLPNHSHPTADRNGIAARLLPVFPSCSWRPR